MSTSLVINSYNEIVQSDSERQNTLVLIALIEAYLSKVTAKHLETVKSHSINQITLKELGRIKEDFFRNSGFNGVCWEYCVFNLIKYNQKMVLELINDAIGYLTRDNTSDELRCILWGGEKKGITADILKNEIGDDDLLWTSHGCVRFIEYIDCIHESFRHKKLRSKLPIYLSDVWRADLFVKRKNSNLWFGVNVKWNYKELTWLRGLPIGIYFLNDGFIKDRNKLDSTPNPYPFYEENLCNYVVCGIPFYTGCGQYYTKMYTFFKELLQIINRNIKPTYVLTFNDPLLYEMMEFFYKLKDEPCINIVEQLRGIYKIPSTVILDSELIISNNPNTEPYNNSLVNDDSTDNDRSLDDVKILID